MAHAYSTPDAYAERPSEGGGGGRWFSGSPADGYSCSVCHSPAAGQRAFPMYVTGLPLEGYTLAEAREVVLSWPQFAQRWRELRPDPMQPMLPGAPQPAMGMVAELVAESGKASGTIEIRGATASEAELCEKTRPNLQPRLGIRLYQVRAGIAPLLVRPDANGTLRCEARHLGQRCLIALNSCGAQQARFIWTAPSTQEGPIWFSAGFVASEQLSGTPDADAVYEISVPMVPGGGASGRYQETLRGTCSVSRVRDDGGHGLWYGVIAGLALALWLRRARVRSSAARPLLALLLLGGCAEHERLEPSSYPSTGLYTPGSTLGASDPTDMPMEGASLGNRCVSLPALPGASDGGVVGSAGTLAITYMTQSYDGRFAPKNCTAVWIETVEGAYVATLEVDAALRRPGLVYWQDHACTQKLGPDAMTSATLRNHDKMHELEWTGLDFEGKAVADGPYKLFIEVTETDKEPGELNVFDISKGPMPYTMELPVALDGTLVHVTATWTVR